MLFCVNNIIRHLFADLSSVYTTDSKSPIFTLCFREATVTLLQAKLAGKQLSSVLFNCRAKALILDLLLPFQSSFLEAL